MGVGWAGVEGVGFWFNEERCNLLRQMMTHCLSPSACLLPPALACSLPLRLPFLILFLSPFHLMQFASKRPDIFEGDEGSMPQLSGGIRDKPGVTALGGESLSAPSLPAAAAAGALASTAGVLPTPPTAPPLLQIPAFTTMTPPPPPPPPSAPLLPSPPVSGRERGVLWGKGRMGEGGRRGGG